MTADTPKQIVSLDDQPDTLVLTKAILQKEGYDVLTLSTPMQLFETLENNKPDLILLDIMMPAMNGYDVCAMIRQRQEWSMIPVIFMSALDREEDKAKAFALGAVDFINKARVLDSLSETIRKHINTRIQWLTRFDPQQAQLTELMEAPSKTMGLFASDYGRFKSFLAEQYQFTIGQVRQLESYAPRQIYEAAQQFGVDQVGVAKALASFFKLDYLETVDFEQLKLGVMPAEYCKKNLVLPLSVGDLEMDFVISNPLDFELLDTLKAFKPRKFRVAEPGVIVSVFTDPSKLKVKTVVKVERNIDDLQLEVRKRYGFEQIDALAAPSSGTGKLALGAPSTAPKSKSPAFDLDSLDLNFDQEEEEDEQEVPVEEGPILSLINQLIINAYRDGASDIHIEPWEKAVVVRYRIDGVLRTITRLTPHNIINPLISRLKIMSNLNIAEKRMPQDGRIIFKQFSREGQNFDLRLSIAPTQHGERAVMRILDKKRTTLSLEELGFSKHNLNLYRQYIQAPYGMVLHVGPTGSGKSMTCYAAVNEVQSPEINVMTIEDPIEYTLPGINQLQVNNDIGLNFQHALRSFLRQDPEVILVGEIRDKETSKIAVEAALTGHLLISTLHTNDAPSTVMRFLEMGIEPFMISSSLVMICAQRLVRRLCPQCKLPHNPTMEERKMLRVPLGEDVVIYEANGCEACLQTGYKGRLGVHEILVPNEAMRLLMNQPGITTEELKRLAVEQCHMQTLFRDAAGKVLEGLTSVAEVLSNIQLDE